MRLKSHHEPRKRFGQNFLQDPLIVQKIITAIHPKPSDRIIEIGPGLGVLTKPVLDLVNHLEVIEIDRDLTQQLKILFGDTQKLTIHTADVLQFDFNTLKNKTSSLKKMRIIGNLPYNISTPVIFHLLKFSTLIEDMYFMLQKEVVDRLVATPHHKEYGRLSIMTQYYCDIHALFTVEPNAFYPSPKVKSAFVCLKPYDSPPFPATNPALLQDITRTAFNYRRKTIFNALKAYLKAEDYTALNLEPTLRPETLSIADFVRISNFVASRPTPPAQDLL